MEEIELKMYAVQRLVADELIDNPVLWERLQPALEHDNEQALLDAGDLPLGEEFRHFVLRPDPMNPADYVVINEKGEMALSRYASVCAIAYLIPKGSD